MDRIVLTEDFDLIETYDKLFESRGVIDGIDFIVSVIYRYSNKILNNSILKKRTYKGYNTKDDVDIYEFAIPSEKFDDGDTLFMKSPVFNIHVFEMRNKYADKERELGETNYVYSYNLDIRNFDGRYYLYNPQFNLSFNIIEGENIDMEDMAIKVSHELIHAKRSFYEIIRCSKNRRETFERNVATMELLTSDEKDETKRLIGRILYLCSDDEINARASQLYYELKGLRYIDRKNINKFIEKSKVYSFVNEFDDKLKTIIEMESKRNGVELNYIKTLMDFVYKQKNVGDNPYEFLTNLLISKKNYFIRQMDKVKERVIYEKLNEPLIIGHPEVNDWNGPIYQTYP